MSLPGQRFLALDVFRGMTICLMIIVNTPGNEATTYAPLLHASWHGFTPTDLVFPSFMFAVGNALSFVMRKWEFMSTSKVVGKILKRSALIFLLGFLMYWFPFFKYNEQHQLVLSPFSETRVFGVLQRIAIAYMLAALMLYFFKTRATVIITAIILLLYKPVLMMFGDLTLTGNAVLKLDTWLLGVKHLYMGEGLPFDPEGLLSTLPSIGNVVAGFVAGKYIQERGKTYEGLAKLMIAGFGLFIVAYWWNLGFPINKKLWTSTFVLHTVGLDCMILACIIYVVDFLGRTKGTYFFQVFGKNPLFIYLLSEIGVIILWMIPVNGVPLFQWLYKNIFEYAGAYFGSFLFAVSWMLFCWLVGLILDKRKIYVRV
ncbi:heparan-alpha-glucosaminide N-acetyltransferase domain-containing protein [Danxiaibacter flavus]|uniref:Heparan-alpha-glucosaminide N-acetyltransferase domain-containing protein n=1 Tax=Danxiaibacter flavus TaxID=3049108 RepID=A0ABV3ZLG5_9BACT|nr:heparan-alpha-glucosaminide N-acetyltransferase domain-containing protein [Chitinophagaceae bacterium DXS]